MTKYYTGIGSRETPQDVLELMQKIATKLDSDGFVLRSGGTAMAISIANTYLIPVFNLWHPEVVDRFRKYVA